MDDYRTKRRYRQQKLERQGFYDLRRRRKRRRAEQDNAAGNLPQFEQVFAAEKLISIYYDLQHRAGQAAGPDGITYDQLGPREVASVMRQLSRDILSGKYHPSTARNVKIKKAHGGYRTLKLRSILYRVAAAALAVALGPYFDRMFLPESHGYRPGRGPWSMLLHLERIMIGQQRFVIAQDDIKQAFDHVPIEFVTRLLSEHVSDQKLLIFANKILRGHESNRTVGIDQGSGLSPLMLNVALHHQLDVPFSNAAHLPWLRYADNLVYLTKSVHEGRTAIQAAQTLLAPIGMTLKGKDGPPVDLLRGQTASILGFNIRWDTRVNYDLTEETWSNLKVKLSETHSHASPNATDQAVKGWMDSCGPAFEGKSESPILNRVLEISAEAGQRELSHRRLKRYLQASRDRWVFFRKGNALNAYRGIRDRGGEVAPLTTDRTGHLDMPEAESSQVNPAAVLAP